ncbi:probable calcium-binding protein CML23 [Magnolia sinica]|uniref:probable calcium-binding protein CML23 n=1 Tax=Magnolia sinica TaxID=86752 RepID=UPI0026599211|nr:probable calcium-binding protein CML23 [Magnolia sinica]
MVWSQSLHFSPLGKWVTTIFHQLKRKCKIKKPKRLSNGFDWFSSSFAAMEISNQLKQVFKLIDTNGDGKISPLELREVLVCLGHDKSKAAKEAEGMVKEMDCNGDGFIDLEEFMEVVEGRTENGCGSKDDLMDAFLVFDSDRNGFISAQELQRVLISLGYKKCSLDDCFLMIRGVDSNGDGLVDFDEFRSMMTKRTG